MIPTLYELAQTALDEAYRLRCESLLQDAFENIPTPIQQNGSLQKIRLGPGSESDEELGTELHSQ